MKLTTKQNLFAETIAKGKVNSLSDAYRMHYKTDKMKASTVHQEACKLAANPKVTERILEVRQQIDRAMVASAVSDEDRIRTKLRTLLDEATGLPAENVMLRAADLLAKVNGLYVTKIEDSRVKTPEEVRAELEARLNQLESRDTRH